MGAAGGSADYDEPWGVPPNDVPQALRPMWRQYRRTAIAEMTDWSPEYPMLAVSVSDVDRRAGSPKPGDKIARNPANHEDQWLVSADYFAANFAELELAQHQ